MNEKIVKYCHCGKRLGRGNKSGLCQKHRAIENGGYASYRKKVKLERYVSSHGKILWDNVKDDDAKVKNRARKA